MPAKTNELVLAINSTTEGHREYCLVNDVILAPRLECQKPARKQWRLSIYAGGSAALPPDVRKASGFPARPLLRLMRLRLLFARRSLADYPGTNR
jgi:hypothetical protein